MDAGFRSRILFPSELDLSVEEEKLLLNHFDPDAYFGEIATALGLHPLLAEYPETLDGQVALLAHYLGIPDNEIKVEPSPKDPAYVAIRFSVSGEQEKPPGILVFHNRYMEDPETRLFKGQLGMGDFEDAFEGDIVEAIDSGHWRAVSSPEELIRELISNFPGKIESTLPKTLSARNILDLLHISGIRTRLSDNYCPLCMQTSECYHVGISSPEHAEIMGKLFAAFHRCRLAVLSRKEES